MCVCACVADRKIPGLCKLSSNAYYYHIGIELLSGCTIGFCPQNCSSNNFYKIVAKDWQQFFYFNFEKNRFLFYCLSATSYLHSLLPFPLRLSYRMGLMTKLLSTEQKYSKY